MASKIKRSKLIILMLVVVFVGLLAYGVFTGDAQYVWDNASGICFT